MTPEACLRERSLPRRGVDVGRSHTARWPLSFLAFFIMVASLALALPVGASAGGGTSIATAPELPLGTTIIGATSAAEFWRLTLAAGDSVTIDWKPINGGGVGFDLYSPEVTDFTIGSSSGVWAHFTTAPAQSSWTCTRQGSWIFRVHSDHGYQLIATVERLTYTISPSVPGGHGQISPAGAQRVTPGSTPTFAFTPDVGYHVAQVTVDGRAVAMTATDYYTFPVVSSDHSINVRFAPDVVTPVIGTPRCASSVKRGQSFTVSGSLSPHFAAGSRIVTVTLYRKSGNSWRTVRSSTAQTSDSGSLSRYSASWRLTTKGSYRFLASIAATSNWTSAVSGYSRAMSVK
jgi:hypothetical protein